MEVGVLEPHSQQLVDASVRSVGDFLGDLETALYWDSRDLYQHHKKPTRTQELLDPKKLPIEFLRKALETIAPAGGNDPQNPTLFYLLDGLLQQREAPLPVSVIIRRPRSTETKQMEWAEQEYTPTVTSERTAVDNAISGVFSMMVAAADIPPCDNPEAGSVARAGRRGYVLNSGNLKGLCEAFRARSGR